MTGIVRARLVALAVLALAGVPARAQSLQTDAFLRAVERATAAAAAQRWKEAAEAWSVAAQLNPHDPVLWVSLGNARFGAGDLAGATTALERAFDYGSSPRFGLAGRPAELAYAIGRLFALRSQRDSALSWLDAALRLGLRNPARALTDSALTALLRAGALPRQMREPVVTRDRVEGWRQDIQFLADEIARMHVSPFRTMPESAFDARVRRLKEQVPTIHDDAIVVGLMRLIAGVGDGHTGIWPDLVPGWTTTLPLQFYLSGDTVRIIGADSVNQSLLGTQVLAVGDRPVAEVLEAIRGIISGDNRLSILRNGPRFLRYPQVLVGLGLQSAGDREVLLVRGSDGRQRTVTVRAVPTPPDYNRITGAPHWARIFDAPKDQLPLFLQDRLTPFWFAHLPLDTAVYFAFNAVVEGSPGEFTRFVDSLFAFVDTNHIERLIVDLRWNNGGNTRQVLPLLTRVIEHPGLNRRGRLFVLISRFTNSAGMNTATYFERGTNAVFVGEPTLSSPNFVGESNLVTLPYSKIMGSISDLYWQSSWPFDYRQWIAPTLHAPVTFEDLRTRNDPGLAAIRTYIKIN